MNSKYTGKLVEDLLDKMSIIESGEVGGVISGKIFEKFLRKDQDDRTEHTLASDKLIEVGNFVSGTSGAIIYVDKATGHTVAELDKLYVRMKAYFELLEIINVNSVGGKLIVSPAGGIKCSLVETYDSWGYYRCYFLSEQDGEKIENRFAVGDLAYSKTFNAREGSYNKISNRYYWRLVVGRGENYIDLSKTDCDADSDEPQEGDVIVHRGNRNDVDRLNCLEFSSVDSFSPSITLYQGINDYSLSDKNVIQFGVEKSTGKAFMVVYGDMFIGNRDNSSYIKYSPEKGVEIKGSLDIGTKLGDKTLQDAIDLASTSYEEDLNNLKDIINRDILNILNLLDGAIETWFYDPAPTLTNLPASLWTTEADKNVHLGDLYYSGAGRAYRFLYDADNSLYYWQEIVDTDIVLALENAKKAQDTADSKRKIFARKPENSDSYDIGDMWVNANYTDNNVTYKDDLLRAIVTKNAGELFKIEHWTLASKYTDDTVAKDALEKATKAQLTVNTLLSDVTSFKGYVDGAFLDGIIDSSEALAIEKYINQLDTIKQQVDKSYEEIIKNSILENTTYLTNLNNSYTAFSSSYTELIDTINSAISDSKTTDLEKAAVDGKYKTFNDKYRDYTAYLNLAINYIEETINGKVERALLDIGGYKYLKAALLENTSIEGGLIQSSMLSLGYTKNNLFLVMAGTNGLVLDKGDRTIASWFGGGMIDMFDYYDSNTKTFNVPEDVRAAAGLDRMDGTGYRAKGNLWWDETGVIHADPLSFFVGEATVGGLLASFLVVMKEDGKHPLYLIPQVPFLSLEIADYIRIGDALLKYDSTSKAIYVTSVDGTTNMGFYASGYVSAKGKSSSTGGGGGGASALYQLVDVAPNSTNDGVLNATNGSVLMYNGSKWQAGNVVTDISPLTLNVNGSSLFTYDGKSNVTANLTVPTKVSQLTDDVVSGKYLSLSGGTMTGALNFKNGTWNLIGDDAYMGDCNVAGMIGIKGANAATPGFALFNNSGTVLGKLYASGGTLNWSGGTIAATTFSGNAATATALTTSAGSATLPTYFSSGKPVACTASSVFSNLSNSGNSLSVTVAGQNRTLTINYASNAGNADKLDGYHLTSTSSSYVNPWNTVPVIKSDGVMEIGRYLDFHFDNTSNLDYSCRLQTDSNSQNVVRLPSASGTLALVEGSVAYATSAGNADTVDNEHASAFAHIGAHNNLMASSNEFTFASSGFSGIVYINYRTAGGSNGNITEYILCNGAGSLLGTAIHTGNYNSYAPTLTGGGASGTWGINISGNAATATNADKVDDNHLSVWYKHARAYPSGTTTKNWHKVATFSQNTRNKQINTAITFFISEFYSQRIYGIFTVRARAVENATSLEWLTVDFMVNAGIPTTDIVATWKNTGDYNITINIYAYRNGWSSYSFRKIEEQEWGNAQDAWVTLDAYKGGDNCYASIPSDENKTTSVNIDISNNVFSATKLQTARTIWGQSFDGTGNVSGNMIGVGSITRLSRDAVDTDLNGNLKFHNLNSAYTNFWHVDLADETEVLVVHNNGNVGIKHHNPLFPLDIHCSINNPINIETSSSECSIIYGNSSSKWCAGIFPSNNFGFYTSTKEAITVDLSTKGGLRVISGTGRDFISNGVTIGNGDVEQRYITCYGKTDGYINLGYTNSGGNCGEITFHYASNASSSNYLALGFYGKVILKMYYNGYSNFNGDVAATGAVTAKASSSDIRLKTDITDYKALDIIRNHRSVKYHWNAVAKANADVFNDDYWHYGLIAQEMQQDLPQMVSDVFKDYLVIQYERLIPICWKGLQEVDDEVTKLKKKVRKLEMEIRELKQKEDRL